MTEEATKLRSQISDLEESKAGLVQKLKMAHVKLKQYSGNNDSLSAVESGDTSEVQIAKLRREVRQKCEEIANMKEKLEKMKKSVQHYNELAQTAENNLKQSTSDHEKVVKCMQDRFDKNKKQIEELEKMKENLKG